jgi:O-antigen ligase
MIVDKPVTGIGLGNFTAQSFTVSEGIEGKQGMACNTFLEMAAELGIPGFLAYCAIVAGALFSADKLRQEGKRTCDTCLQYTGQALQAGLIGFSAAAIFVSAQYQKPFWIIVALTATFPALLRQQSRRQSRGLQQVAIPRTRIAITNF